MAVKSKGGARRNNSKQKKEGKWAKFMRKLFGKKSAKYLPSEDPLYEYVLVEEKTWVRGRREMVQVEKKRERPLPKGLSNKEKEILEKVRRSAHKLEWEPFSGCCGSCDGCGCCSRLCRTLCRRTAILDLIPLLGTILDVTLGVALVNRRAGKLDLPWHVTANMYKRQAISSIPGLAVAGIGSVWIGYYSVNTRNAWALIRYFEERAAMGQ